MKPYYREPTNNSGEDEQPRTSPVRGKQLLQDDGRQRTEQNICAYSPPKTLHQKKKDDRFAASGSTELNGLVDRSVYSSVPITEARNSQIYGARFVDEIKNAEKPSVYKKSRFMVQAFDDSNDGFLPYRPIVKFLSQRLFLTLSQ